MKKYQDKYYVANSQVFIIINLQKNNDIRCIKIAILLKIEK